MSDDEVPDLVPVDAEVDRRVPVTVLTGFLGSGKTTLLNFILNEQHGMRVAVILNEIGDVEYGNSIERPANNVSDDWVELHNGCICCTVKDQGLDALEQLVRRNGRYDAILIETTGVANPVPVAASFWTDEGLCSDIRLDAIVTVVDSKNVMRHLDNEDRKSCLYQIAAADVLLVNKIDLVDESQLAAVRRRCRAINSAAPMLETTRSQVDLRRILDIGAFDVKRSQAVAAELDADAHAHEHEHEHVHMDEFMAVGLRTDRGPLDEAKMTTWLRSLLWIEDVAPDAQEVLRIKGILHVAGKETRQVLQGLVDLYEVEDGAPWAEAVPGEPAHDGPYSRIIVIGRHLDEASLQRGLDSCVTEGL